jgi:hypothetical protein
VYSIDRAQCQETEPEWIPAVDQNLSLFLFLQHSDPFHSQLSDFMGEEINSTNKSSDLSTLTDEAVVHSRRK